MKCMLWCCARGGGSL